VTELNTLLEEKKQVETALQDSEDKLKELGEENSRLRGERTFLRWNSKFGI
jgi:predicted nuclease with TOPRIM domain